MHNIITEGTAFKNPNGMVLKSTMIEVMFLNPFRPPYMNGERTEL